MLSPDMLPLSEPLKPEVIDLELFFRSSRDLFCIAGFDGYFKKINPSVVETLGYSEEELYSRPINSFVFSEDRAFTEQNRESLRNANLLMNFENRYVTKSGELIWLSWTSVPYPEFKQVFAVAKNITHKKMHEVHRNREFRDLNDLYSGLKELLYTAMHDLRAPAGNILSIFDLYEQLQKPTDEYIECVELLKSSVKNLHGGLENYLDRLLVSSKNSHSHLGHLNFYDSFSRVESGLRSLISDSATKIGVDFSKAEAVWFDETYLDSIFLNLITNSIKYTREGITPEITIFSDEVPGWTRLMIKDNGRGFDMNKIGGRIFQLQERFHDDVEGKGIGLYLIKNHLTKLGGTIDVESCLGEGTTFTISFIKKL